MNKKPTNQLRRIELKRAFYSRGMLLSLTIGCLLSLAHVIQYQILPNYLNRGMIIPEMTEFSKVRTVVPSAIAGSWLAGNPTNWAGFVFFLILPILAMLPFGVSYFSDRESGYLKNLYTRMPRKQYLTNKFLAAFLSGGTAVVVPLVLNLICSLIFLPNLQPPTIHPYNFINPTRFLYELYFSRPLLYIGLFIVLDFLLGGMFACIALAASYLSDYKIIVGIVPFFLQLGIHILATMLGKLDYSSVYFAQAGYGLLHWWIFVLYLLIGMCVSWLCFFHKGVRDDVF
ncbi:MAG: hypothetical protein Q4B39_06160 [[Ruminococcus] gnavus]|nr:hypothetical protein [Mediterraneibacter gnavus]